MLTITLPLPKVPEVSGIFERTSAAFSDVGIVISELNRDLNRLLMGYTGIAGNKLFICIPTSEDVHRLKPILIALRDQGAVIRRRH